MRKRIGMILKNSTNFIEILLHIWSQDDIAVIIDQSLPTKIIKEQLIISNVEYVFIEDDKLKKNDDLSNFLANNKKISNQWESVNSRKISFMFDYSREQFSNNYSKDDALILFSSGTTGYPKGIVLSHRAINLNAELVAENMNLTLNDKFIIVKSLCHASTLVCELLVALKNKLDIWVLPNITSPFKQLTEINNLNASIMGVAPTTLSLFVDILERQKERRESFKSLRLLYVSGSVLSNNLIKKARSLLPKTKIINVYGLTECGPRVTTNRNDSTMNNSVGVPLEGVEIKIKNRKNYTHDGALIGDIYVKTPCIYTRYLNSSKAKCDWYFTGDVGFIDENGFLYVVGRSDNFIDIKGKLVNPEYIETVLESNFTNSEFLIYSVPDKKAINILKCYYSKKRIKENMLRQFCIENLATYEIPKKFKYVYNLKKTYSGKKIRNKIIETME